MLRKLIYLLICIVFLTFSVVDVNAAAFRPFSGGLSGGGPGDLDKPTGTEDKDVGVVALKGYTGQADEGDWYESGTGVSLGNVFLFYVLNDSGGSGDSWPEYGAAGDGGTERWEYTGFYQVKDEYIPATWMDLGTTDPDPPSEIYTTAVNNRQYKVRTFSGTVDENTTFVWVAPMDIVGLYLQYRWRAIVSSLTGPSASTIEFEIGAVALGDGDEGGPATPSLTAVQKTGVTADQDDILISSWVTGGTVITNLSAGDIVLFFVNRDADGGDTYGQDLGLMGVDVKFKTVSSASF